MKKGFIFLTSTLIFLAFLSLFLAIFIINEEEVIGGEKDSHGCLIGAGYSWNEEIGACIRSWEINEEDKEMISLITNELKSIRNIEEITFISIEKLNCENCFNLEFDLDGNREAFFVENFEIKEELQKIYCSEESKLGNICTLDYNPVCGYPNRITYGNACQACHEETVIYYLGGECK